MQMNMENHCRTHISTIPDGVTDQNKVDFGSGTLNPLKKESGVALKFLLEGAKKVEKTQQQFLKRPLKILIQKKQSQI